MSGPSNSANGAMLSPSATAIETASGQFVDVRFPDPATLNLGDIAHALSLTCRYGGHVRRFYSVAEHAMLVHDLLAWTGSGAVELRGALFHDAAEAYLGDVVAPLKYALRAGREQGVYDHLTWQMEYAIGRRFDIDTETMSGERLRTADMWALRIEAAELTHSGGAHWRWPGELPNDGRLPAGVDWCGGLTPEAARSAWLERVEQNDRARIA